MPLMSLNTANLSQDEKGINLSRQPASAEGTSEAKGGGGGSYTWGGTNGNV